MSKRRRQGPERDPRRKPSDENARRMNKNGSEFIRRNPGKPFRRRKGVKKYYALYHQIVPNDEHFIQGVGIFQLHFLELYMKRIPHYEESTDSIATPKPRVFESDLLINRMRRILRQRGWTAAPIHVSTPNYSVYVYLTPVQPNGEIDISCAIIDEKTKTARIGILIADPKERVISDTTYGVFVYAGSQKEAERAYRGIDERNDPMIDVINNGDYKDLVRASAEYVVDYEMILTIDDIVHKYGLEANDVPYKDLWFPEYRPTEIELFRAFAKEGAKGNALIKVTNAYSWVNMSHDHSMYDKLSYEPIPSVIIDPIDESIPLLDLTEREMGYINRYADKLGFNSVEVKDAKDPVNPDRIDLLQYLTEPRYGNTLRYVVPNNEGIKEHMCVTSYQLYPDNDFFRFYIVYQPTPDITVYILADFDHIQGFRTLDSMSSIACDVLQRDPEKLVTSWMEMMDYVPDFMRSFRSVLDVVIDLVSTHIIIHDRPQRLRMIRYEPRGPREPNPNRQHQEPEFVVRRILKPLKEARRLVRESQSDNPDPEFRDVQYVMDKWDRVGHWRRLPNSEEQIWIEPTTCIRHLPLSDKEVHIKL